MVYKAIIDSLLDDGYQAKIRIPYLDKLPSVAGSTSNFNLYTACICTMPGCYPTYMPGDVVFVEFEQDDMSKPFIIGALYRNQMPSKLSVIADDIYADAPIKILPTKDIKKGVIEAQGGGSDIPSQAGNAGKALTTDGSTLSWSTISGTLPVVTSENNGKFLRVVDGEWSIADATVYNGETS